MYILTLDYDKRENKLVMGIYNGKLDKLSASSSSVNVFCNIVKTLNSITVNSIQNQSYNFFS